MQRPKPPKYEVYCNSCGYAKQYHTIKVAFADRNKHRRTNPCDWFLEDMSNCHVRRLSDNEVMFQTRDTRGYIGSSRRRPNEIQNTEEKQTHKTISD